MSAGAQRGAGGAPGEDERDASRCGANGADGSDYDLLVDWDKRLAREGPFFERVFAEHEVSSVIDVGCGTGRHALLFASWGLSVTGVDPDGGMLASAEAASGASGARFVQGGFGDLARLGLGPADAITCTGNALPHVAGTRGLREALADMASVTREGGVLVLHLLNHARLMRGGIRAIPPVVREAPDGTWVFLRVIDAVPDGIRFDFVTLRRPPDAWETEARWETRSRRSVHAALPALLLLTEVEAAGYVEVRLYGDHAGRALDETADESLVLVATRRRG